MDVIGVSSQRRRQLVDVTSFVQESVAASGVEEGLCHVFVPHTTAALLINENADPAVPEDILAALAAMLPDLTWRHTEGNSDAHVKTSLVGSQVMVPVEAGRLRLGTWQSIYLAEFDGPRTRQVHLTLLVG